MSLPEASAVIGFMQGRFTPMVAGRIQAFPWDHWRREFALAQQHGFSIMEWTLDQDRLDENPLMIPAGREEIRMLERRHGLRIPSLTGDCFMQAPFYKREGARRSHPSDLRRILDASAELGIRYVIIPLVDDGRIETEEEEAILRETLMALEPHLITKNISILFESDFPPERLARFISDFPAEAFGINYDIGNSASRGFDFREEFAAYGDRILNVHIKDRLRGGTTVPLGEGAADLAGVVRELQKRDYAGGWILQAARAPKGDDAVILCRYRDMMMGYFELKEEAQG